ncbi:hypothetical protein [Streptomyces sp. B6B3]|uniref:hypothetical protein n=1 Tax=Streptomyces sp. B6B3 TaxID=3153570 RepID=UPI00325D4563
MTVNRLILVLPDREAADEVAAELAVRYALPENPRPVREALAGEDDAEDAQWLLVVERPADEVEALTALVEAHDGWLERD